ncbi:5662_t:CDS:2, partial [Dentiscutata erythropus]
MKERTKYSITLTKEVGPAELKESVREVLEVVVGLLNDRKSEKDEKAKVSTLRVDLAPIFEEMAVGYSSHRPQWEALEYLGDSALEHCLFKIAKADIFPLIRLNDMEFEQVKKYHGDAFEAYI